MNLKNHWRRVRSHHLLETTQVVNGVAANHATAMIYPSAGLRVASVTMRFYIPEQKELTFRERFRTVRDARQYVEETIKKHWAPKKPKPAPLIPKTREYLVTGFSIHNEFTDRSVRVHALSAEEALQTAARKVSGVCTEDTVVQRRAKYALHGL